MTGTLYVIATPIGNLQDISLRAIETLRNVDLVACEDTRHSGKLLKHFDIKNTLLSYHAHNEASRKLDLIIHLRAGKDVALISDAGMPGISDPGYELIYAIREAGLDVVVVPGPTAFVTAVVLSGLPTDSIYFGGFLPAKKAARRKVLQAVADLKATLVFYESPKRIATSLEDCLAVLGPRKAAVVRELTKLHEETISETLNELAAKFRGKPVKGELVLIIDREKPQTDYPDPEAELLRLLENYEAAGIDNKTALKRAAKECGFSKPEAYRIMQNAKDSAGEA